MQSAHIRQALVALAAALAGLPALASHVHPGTLCTPEGSVKRSVTGLMVSTVTDGVGTTYFHCPIVFSRPASSNPALLVIKVNAKTSNSSTAALILL